MEIEKFEKPVIRLDPEKYVGVLIFAHKLIFFYFKTKWYRRILKNYHQSSPKQVLQHVGAQFSVTFFIRPSYKVMTCYFQQKVPVKVFVLLLWQKPNTAFDFKIVIIFLFHFLPWKYHASIVLFLMCFQYVAARASDGVCVYCLLIKKTVTNYSSAMVGYA